MILSNQLIFSDSQAITADAASTNIIDLLAAGIAYGDAAALAHDRTRIKRIPILFQVTEAFNTLTSLAVSLQTDSASAFGSPATVWTHTFLLADLTLGARLPFEILPNKVVEQYMRLYYDVGGSNPTLGKIFAGIVPSVQNNP
jgi:hypothetical protein